MSNSLFKQLSNNLNSDVGYTLRNLMNSQNPYQALMNLSRNDNRVASVINEINQNGGNAKSLFYAKAKQMGVDPNVILNKLK